MQSCRCSIPEAAGGLFTLSPLFFVRRRRLLDRLTSFNKTNEDQRSDTDKRITTFEWINLKAHITNKEIFIKPLKLKRLDLRREGGKKCLYIAWSPR